MDQTTLQMAMNAMKDRNAVAREVAKKPNITTPTLYTYINGDGSLKKAGQEILTRTLNLTAC